MADRLSARDQSLIASEITANEYIDSNEYLLTCETLAMRNDKNLLRGPDGKAEEHKQECEVIKDIIQAPTKGTLRFSLSMTSQLYYLNSDCFFGVKCAQRLEKA